LFFSRLTTYISGTTPKIKADDLNALQDQAALLARLTLTGRRVCDDDFSSGTLSAQWTITTSGGGGVSWASDDANDGYGANILSGSSVSTSKILSTAKVSILTRDFYMSMRTRLASGSAYSNYFGLYSGTAANKLQFLSWSGNNLMLQINGASVDLGIPLIGSAYSELELYRVSGVLYALVNGSQVHSAAYANSIADAQVQLETDTTSATSVYNDRTRLLVDQ
jgi:hypothetical protein